MESDRTAVLEMRFYRGRVASGGRTEGGENTADSTRYTVVLRTRHVTLSLRALEPLRSGHKNLPSLRVLPRGPYTLPPREHTFITAASSPVSAAYPSPQIRQHSHMGH